MPSNYYKERLRKAIEQAVRRLLDDSGQPAERYLYLTKKQYESNPNVWHDILRQRGLPEDAIIFIPDVFDTKGGVEEHG